MSKMDSDDEFDKCVWFVLECLDEDSFVLIRETKVIFNEITSVKIGQEVVFYKWKTVHRRSESIFR